MVSDLLSKLRLANNERLKLFAFADELFNDHDALATTSWIHQDGYLFLQEMVTAMFQSRKAQK